MKHFASRIFLIVLIVLSSISAIAAPVVPDAGQTMRELQKIPELNTQKEAAPLRFDGETTSKGASQNDGRLYVRAIHVYGSTLFAAKDLEALLADLVGGERSLDELNNGAARISDYYRERGYEVARAYLPAQDVKDGVLSVNVLEGLIGEQHINNQSLLPDELVRGYLANIKGGDILNAQPIDQALLLLGDLPGVGGTRAALQSGASVGTTDLLIELDPSKLFNANINLDNYGNRYTGEYRLDSALALNSPLRIGDQFIVRAIASNERMHFVRISYQIPVGVEGLKIGGAYSDTRYRLGKEYASLQAQGSANSASVYVSYSFIRSPSTNLNESLTWERRTLIDQTDVPVSSMENHLELINLRLVGSHQDKLLGGGVTTLDVTVATGMLKMDEISLLIDEASTKSSGKFSRLSYNLSRQQQLADTDTLSIIISGQQANKNLNSSEKMSLGGVYGVRAYPQGEGTGDQGWMVNLEAQHNLTEKLQCIVFFDEGSVTVNHAPFSAAANSRRIAGAGVGANAQYGWLQFNAFLAWRTIGDQPQSEPSTVNHNPRLWMQMGRQF